MRVRKPSLPVTLARIVLFTFLFTLLAFAVSLFASIAWLLIGSATRGGTPDLTIAYRTVGVRVAAIAAPLAFAGAAFFEVRAYLRARDAARPLTFRA